MGAVSTAVPLAAGAPSRGERLARRTSVRVALAEMLASGLGAVDVFLLLWLVLPKPPHDADQQTLLAVNAAACVVYILLAGIAGVVWGNRSFAAATGWLREDRAPTEAERAAVLRQPAVCAALRGPRLGGRGGRLRAHQPPGVARPGVPRRLDDPHGRAHVHGPRLPARRARDAAGHRRGARRGPVRRPRGPGVVARLLLAWVFATGVPLAGLLMLGGQMLKDPGDATLHKVSLSVVVLAGLGAAAGLFATWLVARSLADPLTSVQRALKRFEEGDLSARVTVDDGSEVGLLQSGFNAMAAGVAEREQLRDAFGRHVGEDVARRALDGDGPRLGGEVREVAVLFVDLVGSTSLAARLKPDDVVRVLNDFFGVVVDVVGRHGGWVNKFEGDAAMAVFGAPGDHEDPAGAALAAGRELRRRLHVVPRVDAGIGLSAGPAVAGYVGAEQRFEYTVIGDPVNEASRLCELAKRRDERLLASSGVLERARSAEAERWTQCDEVLLRGRRTSTRVARPLGAGTAASATGPKVARARE